MSPKRQQKKIQFCGGPNERRKIIFKQKRKKRIQSGKKKKFLYALLKSVISYQFAVLSVLCRRRRSKAEP